MSVPLLPETASLTAVDVDRMYFTLIALCGTVAVGIAAAIVYFGVKYRRSAPFARHIVRQTRPLEHAWTLLPLAAFIGIFVWGAYLFFLVQVPPQDALDVYVVGKQWMWKAQHPEGQREINELHVPVGRSIRLIMTSQDVIHSFFVPAFRVKQDLLPGRYTTLWFQATQTGTFHLFCAEYCGTQHSEMRGRVIVMKPADYERWLSSGSTETLAAAGYRLFRELGCSGCHAPGSRVHAPRLEGVFGRPQPLSTGRFVIADEAYIRDSILFPKKDIVAGYRADMPSFAGKIGEPEILELIAYIKSIADQEPAP